MIKKIIMSMSGGFAAAGATAGLVATIAIAAGATAGASVLLATPVGWGLLATATATALGLGAYQAGKYVAKRWKWTAGHVTGKRSVFKRLGATLAIWTRVGPSKRAEYAAALHRMAGSHNTTLAAEAQRTIAALGLDWDRIKMSEDPESAIKLIAAKMVSYSTLPSAPIPPVEPQHGRDTHAQSDLPSLADDRTSTGPRGTTDARQELARAHADARRELEQLRQSFAARLQELEREKVGQQARVEELRAELAEAHAERRRLRAGLGSPRREFHEAKDAAEAGQETAGHVQGSEHEDVPVAEVEAGRHRGDTGLSHHDAPRQRPADSGRSAGPNVSAFDRVIWRVSTHSTPDDNGEKACVEITVIRRSPR
jgi:hypothetical protein